MTVHTFGNLTSKIFFSLGVHNYRIISWRCKDPIRGEIQGYVVNNAVEELGRIYLAINERHKQNFKQFITVNTIYSWNMVLQAARKHAENAAKNNILNCHATMRKIQTKINEK